MARRPPVPAPLNHDRWLISYADFITLLLALFVVLFASSQPDKKKARQVSYAVTEALEGPGPPVPLAPFARGASRSTPGLTPSMIYLEKALTDEIRTGKIEVHLDSRGLVISLRQAAFFPSGGDEIATTGIESLEKIAATVRDLPNDVLLEGHTDSAPIHNQRFRSNWELSTARSIAMLELFTGVYGIPRARFAVAGYAETKPVDSNDSPEGRSHNRRVDIVILSR
jgi:chemotaxis protein MotB